jgi:methylenetetrahydrofolate dehydrogenase (NADP+)/methenyltetrahydrofolate cyclohydrolase
MAGSLEIKSKSAEIIDGRSMAKMIREQVARAVDNLKREGITPCLSVVRVGDDPSSEIYVRNKERAAAKVGITSKHIHLPADTTATVLEESIQKLNEDDAVDGILLQLPLPSHLVARRLIRTIDPVKDADGFHPLNLGRLIAWDSPLRPCTPSGILALLKNQLDSLRGLHAVVVSRSVVVGRPIAQLLLKADATVTICHRHTRNLSELVGQADILISATGVPKLIEGAWIKRGSVVIDVGITRLPNGKLQGDVDFDSACERAAAITPVPGGVGPMTIAMLLRNTVIAARLRRKLDREPLLDV